MPVSNNPQPEHLSDVDADYLAVTAEVLYLLNLLLLPVIAFVLLLTVYFYKMNSAGELALNHFKQAIFTSLWAGLLLFAVNGFILLLGGYDGPYVWMTVIIYFTLIHASFIMLGVIGLIKALNGQYWRYPLLGYSANVHN